MDNFNFALVRTADMLALEKAILYVNRSRRAPAHYTRIIQTTPRNGWIALIIDSVMPDHYLMRNLSGRLRTHAVELGINNVALYYRLHYDGQTTGAFESHLALWITQQLRLVITTGDITRIDLAEPAGRLVLKRYHEHQQSRAWSQPSANEKIPAEIEQFYIGQAIHLHDLCEPGVDLNYVQDLIKPGFSANQVLTRLAGVLSLPFIKGNPVVVDTKDTPFAPNTNQLKNMNTDELNQQLHRQRIVQGFSTLHPTTWPPTAPLPKGWITLERRQWIEK
jgi:hypothetical protein